MGSRLGPSWILNYIYFFLYKRICLEMEKVSTGLRNWELKMKSILDEIWTSQRIFIASRLRVGQRAWRSLRQLGVSKI
jgi:hypothetical protein